MKHHECAKCGKIKNVCCSSLDYADNYCVECCPNKKEHKERKERDNRRFIKVLSFDKLYGGGIAKLKDEIMTNKVRWSICMSPQLHFKLWKLSKEQSIPIHGIIIRLLEKMTEDVDLDYHSDLNNERCIGE
jgi:hypothetical protein